MPFKNSISNASQVQWFCHRHPQLTLRSLECLEEGQARDLNPTSIASLYHNLNFFYKMYSYPIYHILIVMKVWHRQEDLEVEISYSLSAELDMCMKWYQMQENIILSFHASMIHAKQSLTIISFRKNTYNKDYIVKCNVDTTMSM